MVLTAEAAWTLYSCVDFDLLWPWPGVWPGLTFFLEVLPSRGLVATGAFNRQSKTTHTDTYTHAQPLTDTHSPQLPKQPHTGTYSHKYAHTCTHTFTF